ncbi:S8 family serine peptidase [Ekhidna sp.]|uniref:S8 family serine peptidase n=1 Tax=Ekhidna sp. TaxID=2608089 RepID=UPI003297FC25
MMKVKATKDVHIRSGEAKRNGNSNLKGTLHKGFSIEVIETKNDGEDIDGNSIWYKDKNGDWYWSGGFESNQSSNGIGSEEYWWLNDFNVDVFWKSGYRGSGIKLAVLDTGLSIPHPDLNIYPENIIDVSNSFNGTMDMTGHGTHVTGIIKASHNRIGVLGIAPEIDLYFGKITGDMGDHPDLLAKGINWGISKDVDIISISKGFQLGSNELKRAVMLAIENEILLVCAAGNKIDSNHLEIDFPARYSSECEILVVGGLDKNGNHLLDTVAESATDVFAPGDNIKSTFLNKKYKHQSGSSQATAYVAGIAALALQKSNGRDNSKLIKLITKNSTNKIISPQDIFNHA